MRGEKVLFGRRCITQQKQRAHQFYFFSFFFCFGRSVVLFFLPILCRPEDKGGRLAFARDSPPRFGCFTRENDGLLVSRGIFFNLWASPAKKYKKRTRKTGNNKSERCPRDVHLLLFRDFSSSSSSSSTTFHAMWRSEIINKIEKKQIETEKIPRVLVIHRDDMVRLNNHKNKKNATPVL